MLVPELTTICGRWFLQRSGFTCFSGGTSRAYGVPTGSSWVFSSFPGSGPQDLKNVCHPPPSPFYFDEECMPWTFLPGMSLFTVWWRTGNKKENKKTPEKWDLAAEAKRMSSEGSWQPESSGWIVAFFVFFPFVSRQNTFEGVDYWKSGVQCLFCLLHTVKQTISLLNFSHSTQ